MTEPRLVATDLDGTLLCNDGNVSPLTRRVLAALEARGIPVVLVTARPLRWMDDLWPMVGRHANAVVSNGAIWYDVGRGQVRESAGIDADTGLAICAAITAAIPGATYALECVDGPRRDPYFVDDEPPPPGTPVGSLPEIWTQTAVKLLVRHRGPIDPDLFREQVVHAVGEAAHATWTLPGLVEISAVGVTKAATLARVCEHLGVAAAEVVAFGDMPNDLEMLRWAGVGYAMAGAHPSVIDACDHLAGDNSDDGVARVLAELYAIAVAP